MAHKKFISVFLNGKSVFRLEFVAFLTQPTPPSFRAACLAGVLEDLMDLDEAACPQFSAPNRRLL
jgi:hypothetical protein